MVYDVGHRVEVGERVVDGFAAERARWLTLGDCFAVFVAECGVAAHCRTFRRVSAGAFRTLFGMRIASVFVAGLLGLSVCACSAPVEEDQQAGANEGADQGEGRGGDQGAGEDAPTVEGPAPVEQGDVAALGAELGEAWGVDCEDPLVDGAGYPKVVCPIPDELMSPGMSSNAVAVQSFEEWWQAEEFVELYVPADEGFVAGEGWFVHAPSQEVAEDAAGGLGG